MKSNKYIDTDRAYKIIIALASAVHIVFAVIFFQLHMIGMLWYNIAISLLYVGFYVLISMNYYRLTVVLVHLEVCIFVSVSTLALGWELGFGLYLIALSSLTYYNPFKYKKIVYIFPFMELFCFLILRLLTLAEGNLPFPAKAAPLFYLINSFGCFTIIMAGSMVSKVSLNTITKERDRIALDKLSGVFSREHFVDRVEKTLAENPDGKYVLVLSNISGFKYYNEIYGMEKGNEILRAEGEILKNADASLIWYGRTSGNEFCAFLEQSRFDEEKLVSVVKKIQDRFTSSLYRMHIQVGIFLIQDNTESVYAIMDKAKMAVESLRGEYNKIFAYYDSNMLESSLEEKKLLGEFEQSLNDGQFCFYIQPQFRSNGSCFGAEALVRWERPGQGIVLPGDFIPILEKTGLIWKLDQYIWEKVAGKLREWKDKGKEDMSISINISALDFYYLDIYTVMTSLVERYGIAPGQLKLEITETALMMDIKRQIALFGRLREYGFEIEIDDFGSGYSSLNTLKDIHADVLKLDMVFLQKTEHSGRSWSILSSVIDLSKEIGMLTLTEGVETQDQIQRLTELGCDMFQGYYYSKPLPVGIFEEKYL